MIGEERGVQGIWEVWMTRKVLVTRTMQEVRATRKVPVARATLEVRAIQEVRGFQVFLHFLNKPYDFMEKFCFM